MAADLYTPAKFDVNLTLSDERTGIKGTLNYALSLFDEDSMARMADVYQRVLQAFVAEPSKACRRLR